MHAAGLGSRAVIGGLLVGLYLVRPRPRRKHGGGARDLAPAQRPDLTFAWANGIRPWAYRPIGYGSFCSRQFPRTSRMAPKSLSPTSRSGSPLSLKTTLCLRAGRPGMVHGVV